MLFMDRFKVPQFTGILTYEDPEILVNVYADEALLKRYQFRQILPEEGTQAGEMDSVCFPPEEAKPMEIMCRFAGELPEIFLVAIDRETGKVAGFLCGIASDEAHFSDAFFTDLSLHDPAAQTVYLLGLDILPRYRRQGLAGELLRLYEIWSQVRGKHRMVLTAHKEKVGMYEKMGFTDLGISDSVWGGGVWHEMERRLQ
jgi:ribosomal protein S18 acetylase RimI-like enzyme